MLGRLLVTAAAVVSLIAGACSDDGDDDGAAPSSTTTATTEAPDPGPTEPDPDDDEPSGPECLLDEEQVAVATGDQVESVEPRFGSIGRSNDEHEVSLSDEGCRYLLASGGSVTVAEVVDTDDATAAEGFDDLIAYDGGEGTVTDVGDAAVLLDDELLYLRVDDRVLVAKDQRDVPDPDVLLALAAELLAVDAG